MTKSLPFALLAGASLVSGTAAFALTPQTTATHPVAAKRTVATTTRTTTKTTTVKPRTVTAKLANGKTVTYNCALPGNASKQACK
jgi:dipeptidyl aminopeptidase/acylaminoacyl peptidase